MVRPFYCGSQYGDWTARNCDKCVKYNYENPKKSCTIDYALGTAYMTTGEVSDEIAKRMGFTGESYSWQCPERVTPEEQALKEKLALYQLPGQIALLEVEDGK